MGDVIHLDDYRIRRDVYHLLGSESLVFQRTMNSGQEHLVLAMIDNVDKDFIDSNVVPYLVYQGKMLKPIYFGNDEWDLDPRGVLSPYLYNLVHDQVGMILRHPSIKFRHISKHAVGQNISSR